ncbi:MAG: hypothetical protein QM809_11415 [Gordonia sp. (in: high G+C Gram-positive bacteria)]|uniref:hypothetical protein n=1 Tax=Gordonia sp. (in: high G+C Gram-positive bacteria) TaxID=84139 RepID=UPI0039E3A4DC
MTDEAKTTTTMGGTASSWRCLVCGCTWTWRATYAGFAAYAAMQREHNGRLVLVDPMCAGED